MSCTKHAPISSQTLRRGLLGHVELRVSKKLCKGAGLPIIYEAAEAPEIIVHLIAAERPPRDPLSDDGEHWH